MKKVVYFGMGFLPDGNAVAIREMIIADMLKELHFEPILIGISKNISVGKYEKKSYNGITVYEVGYAQSPIDKLKDNWIFANVIINILQDIGINNIHTYIMQDYQYGPMKRLIKFCNKNRIYFIADIMDWFVPTADASIFKNIFKSLDTYRRMYLLYPRLNKMICISNTFKEFFEKNKKISIAVIPPVVHKINKKNISKKSDDNKIELVFAGNPGKRFEKEKLDWVIKALFENKSNMILRILGANKETTINNNPDLAQYITENIIFMGQQSHNHSKDVLMNSDFSLVIRKKTKLSHYGFSSKISEAFQCGVPVLATEVSDNSKYILEGINGYVCDCVYTEVKKMLKNVEKLSFDEIEKMKYSSYQNSLLYCEQYINVLGELIGKA